MVFKFSLDGDGLIIGIVIFAIIAVPAFFYMLTLQNTLKAIAPQNRRIAPGQVWLMFIPVFNLVWQFIVIVKLADSIQAELNMRQARIAERTFGVGLTFCILPFFYWLPLLGILSIIGTFICWITHWVKANEYKDMFLSQLYFPDADSRIFNNTL